MINSTCCLQGRHPGGTLSLRITVRRWRWRRWWCTVRRGRTSGLASRHPAPPPTPRWSPTAEQVSRRAASTTVPEKFLWHSVFCFQVGLGGSRPASSWSSNHEELQGGSTAFSNVALPVSLLITQSVCVCAQEFLLNTEDSVDETEAVKRYNQYKLDFRRQQLQDFFLQHKDQEWFRSKYHPDDIAARKAESLAALKTRLGVFLFLLENNWLDNVLLDMDHSPAIIKLLDAGR